MTVFQTKRKLLKMQSMKSRNRFSQRPWPSKYGNLIMNGSEDILSTLVDMSGSSFDCFIN